MKKMNRCKHFTFICLLLLGACMLSACSLSPKKSSAKKAEQYAQKYINKQVSLADNKRETEKNVGGMDTHYHLKDERGIDFDVIVENEFVSLVEPIPNIYSNVVSYRSTYKKAVMDYYREEIEEVISGLDVEKVTFSKNSANISLTMNEGESLEKIADAIMEIDQILAYDHNSSEEYRLVIGTNTCWDNSSSEGLHLEMNDDTGRYGNGLFENFRFSDNNQYFLTYQDVLRTLKANQLLNTSSEKLYFVRVDGKLYYGSDVVYEDAPNDDNIAYDGIIEKHVYNIPQRGGEGNVGAGEHYKYDSDGSLLLYKYDGYRRLVEFTE